MVYASHFRWNIRNFVYVVLGFRIKKIAYAVKSPLGCYISTQSFCVIAWVPSQYHPFVPIKDIDLIKKKEKKKILIFYSFFFFFFADWYWYFIQLKKNILIFCVMCNIIWREISLEFLPYKVTILILFIPLKLW